MDARDFHRDNFPGNGKIEVILKIPLTRIGINLFNCWGVV